MRINSPPKKKRHEVELNLRKLNKDFEQAAYTSQKLQKKILLLIQKAENLTLPSKRKRAMPKKIINEQKQLQVLIKLEGKFTSHSALLEKSMQKLDETIAARSDQELETEKVIDEALKKGCNLIISHHPLIFEPIKSIISDSWISRTIEKAIKNNINIYAFHTNLDNVITGVNKKYLILLD